MDKDKVLAILPDLGLHPIVDMAWLGIREGANPEVVLEYMISTLVEELNRHRPLAPEAAKHTHYHTDGSVAQFPPRHW